MAADGDDEVRRFCFPVNFDVVQGAGEGAARRQRSGDAFENTEVCFVEREGSLQRRVARFGAVPGPEGAGGDNLTRRHRVGQRRRVRHRLIDSDAPHLERMNLPCFGGFVSFARHDDEPRVLRVEPVDHHVRAREQRLFRFPFPRRGANSRYRSAAVVQPVIAPVVGVVVPVIMRRDRNIQPFQRNVAHLFAESTDEVGVDREALHGNERRKIRPAPVPDE